MYALAVVNDLVFSLQAARQRRGQTLRVLRVGRRVARDSPPHQAQSAKHLAADASALAATHKRLGSRVKSSSRLQ
jgi:hypothetical protein